jgi:MFS family permease
MLTTYRRLLALPGALVFSMSGLVARLPIAMVSLGLVLLVSARTGSYSLAGAVSASFLIANAAVAVLQARLIDRLGQGRVLLPAALGFSAGMVATMAAVQLDRPAPWPQLCAALSGAAMPQIGSSIRARWSHLVPDPVQLRTAFAFESVVDESVFILGPALVTVLATAVHPLAGLGCAVLATLVGTSVLVSQKRTEPPTGGRSRGARGPIPWRLVGPLVGCAFAMGVLLGGAEVATVAFADEHGATALAGPLLAVWALGSLLSGVVTGAVHSTVPNATRFRWGMLALGVLMVPLPFVHGFVLLGVMLFLSGISISPTLIAGFAWIQETVPPERITEGITLFTTGLAAGLAPGAALVGRVVDASSASASYGVTVVAGLAGAALAFLSAARASPSGSSGSSRHRRS